MGFKLINRQILWMLQELETKTFREENPDIPITQDFALYWIFQISGSEFIYPYAAKLQHLYRADNDVNLYLIDKTPEIWSNPSALTSIFLRLETTNVHDSKPWSTLNKLLLGKYESVSMAQELSSQHLLDERDDPFMIINDLENWRVIANNSS